ncbi:hypothetical protein TcWFU_005485 [Taenia crassiceps]|uniref:Uncharacterized protein n=1 Tax=Taenia crassiceps TaxID=6207 RepID=A0ABR4QDU6_9CEST
MLRQNDDRDKMEGCILLIPFLFSSSPPPLFSSSPHVFCHLCYAKDACIETSLSGEPKRKYDQNMAQRVAVTTPEMPGSQQRLPPSPPPTSAAADAAAGADAALLLQRPRRWSRWAVCFALPHSLPTVSGNGRPMATAAMWVGVLSPEWSACTASRRLVPVDCTEVCRGCAKRA